MKLAKTKEHREKLSALYKGKPLSEETKQKMRDAIRKTKSEEHKRKLSESLKGKSKSVNLRKGKEIH